MLLTFILGFAAGWGAGYADPHVRSALAGVLVDDAAALEPVELRMLSFAACLLLAALLAWIFADAHAVPLALGAALGALAPRLRDKFRAARAPDYDS